VKRICLDTSAYGHFKRRELAAVEVVTAASEVLVPSVVLGELRTGFRLGNRRLQNEKELRQFLASGAVRVVDVDDDVSSIYADIVIELREAGTPIPTNDVWIAASAAREAATVVTYDGHFDRVRRVGVRILPLPGG
jgi:tRNA(fMet)-specific endonuclease VapC